MVLYVAGLRTFSQQDLQKLPDGFASRAPGRRSSGPRTGIQCMLPSLGEAWALLSPGTKNERRSSSNDSCMVEPCASAGSPWAAY